MATSLDAINQLTDNIYDYLANLDGQLYQQAVDQYGAESPQAKTISARITSTSTFLLDPFYQQLLEAAQPLTGPTTYQYISPTVFTFDTTFQAPLAPYATASATAPTEPTTTTTPTTTLAEPIISPTPTVPTAEQLATLTPELQTALNLQYTADNNLLLTQENQLLYAILQTLQIATIQGGAAIQFKEFRGFTTTGERQHFSSIDQVPSSVDRINKTALIPYPFVIRNIYASSQVLTEINTPSITIQVDNPGITFSPASQLPRPIWTPRTPNYSVSFGASGVLNIPINHLVPDTNKAIYWELHNPQTVDNEMSVLITIERLIPDAEPLQIQ